MARWCIAAGGSFECARDGQDHVFRVMDMRLDHDTAISDIKTLVFVFHATEQKRHQTLRYLPLG